MDKTIQQIFKKFGKEYLKKYRPNFEQRAVFNKILYCKTETLGTRIYKCVDCGEQIFAYNSCKDRHCPNCQDYQKESWIEKHKQDILNTPYFHIVLAVPIELRPLFYYNKQIMYNLLFETGTDTILELCESKEYLGAKVGITAMLHTWSQKANYHPHLHMIVTGGGIDFKGNYIYSRTKELLPIDVVEKKFKSKLLKRIKEVKLKFYGKHIDLSTKANLKAYLKPLYDKQWICYSKQPFTNVHETYEYLGEYAFKVCMSNERIVKVDDSRVWFSYHNYKNRGEKRIISIKGEDFIRKFLLHALPKSFIKIRYYGILAGKNKTIRMTMLKKLTNTAFNKYERISKIEILNRLLGRDVTKCSECGGHLELIVQTKPPQKEKKVTEKKLVSIWRY